MDLKKYLHIVVAAVVASVLKIAFKLDNLVAAIVFGICLGVAYFVAAKLGYIRIAPKKTS